MNMSIEMIACLAVNFLTLVKLFMVSSKLDKLTMPKPTPESAPNNPPDITGDLERRLLDIQQSRYAKNYFKR